MTAVQRDLLHNLVIDNLPHAGCGCIHEGGFRNDLDPFRSFTDF